MIEMLLNPTAKAIDLIMGAAEKLRDQQMTEKPSREALQAIMRERFGDGSALDYIKQQKNRRRNKDYGANYPTEDDMKRANSMAGVAPVFTSLSDEQALTLIRMDDTKFERILIGEWGSNWAHGARLAIPAREAAQAARPKEKPRDPFARKLDIDFD